MSKLQLTLQMFFIVLVVVSASGAEKNVAVYMAGYEPSGATGAHKVMGGELEKALSRSGKYVAVNRTEEILDAIAKEHIYSRSGEVDDDGIMALGRQLGVQYLCIVEISDLRDVAAFYLTARLVDVVTAKNIKTATAVSDLYSSQEMMAVAQQIAQELVGAKGDGGKKQAQPYKNAASKLKTKWMSAGLSGYYAGDFGGGLAWNPSGQVLAMPDHGMGVCVFFDLLYADMFVGYSGTISTPDSAAKAAGDKSDGTRWRSAAATSDDGLPGMSRSYLNFGLFAKFPFALDPSGYNRAYPLIGVEYAAAVSGKLKYTNGNEYVFDGRNGRPAARAMSAQWIKFGGGFDFGNEHAFWRIEVLYGIRSANAFEQDEVAVEQGNGRDASANLGHGLTVKIGFGM
ncbi:hypothetical protein R80B4_01507 [Fibrobacteres bacterium R8-0-B4]